MDKFTQGYIEAALWSSTDDSGEPLDSNYSLADIAPETLKHMARDCVKFQADNAALLAEWPRSDDYSGHDFWLTRNGHGTGFWDRYLEYPDDRERVKALGEKLTKAAHAFGEFDLYIGDDGLIYGQ